MAHEVKGSEGTSLINDSAVLDFREDQAKLIREIAGLTCSSSESSSSSAAATSSAAAAAASDEPPHPILRGNSHEISDWVGSRPRHGDGRLMTRETIIEKEEIELAKVLSLSAAQAASKDEEESASTSASTSTSEAGKNRAEENEHTPYLDVSLAMPYVSDMTEDEELDLALALSASRAETTEADKDKDDDSEDETPTYMTQERPSGTTVDWREHSRGLTLGHRAEETKDSDI